MKSSFLYRRVLFKALVCAFAALVPCASVWSQSGGGRELKQSVIAGGGTTSSVGGLQITGTVGQSAAGKQMSGGTFTQVGGFWQPNANSAPTDMSLSNASVPDHSPIGTTVGLLSSTDSDPNSTFFYTLVSGQGSIDNSFFSITGNALKTAAAINSATRSSYSIRVRTTDQFGLFLERQFMITVTNVGTIQFSSPTYSVTENAGIASITISRTGSNAGVATVQFSASNGTAGPSDYTSVTQTVTFNDGETSKIVSVQIANDSSSEISETVNLALSQITGSAGPGAVLQAVLTITDDDPLGGVISFSHANYSVTETGPGFVDITVTRTGDTSRAATVDYATPDDSDSLTAVPCAVTNGVASSRCDFTTALGTLRFAAGETSRSFTVLISQDSYLEGPETLQLVLSNLTGGAAFGPRVAAELTILDDLTEAPDSPIDEPSNYVRQHYHDFLNREPDASGLAFWTNQITECGSNQECINLKRINVSAAFFLSIEFQQTGYLVERFYKTAYGDSVGTSTLDGVHQLAVPIMRVDEFLLDTQQISQSVVVGQNGWETLLENNKRTFASTFTQRSRFALAFPASMSAAEFVDRLNTNAGNPLSTTERDQLVDALVAGTRTRAQVLRAVAEDRDLESAEFNKAFVLMQYFGYLRRHPNSAPDGDWTGFDFWLRKMNQFHGNFFNAEMVKAFIDSAEYRLRFDQ
jgi:hypothetical protein